MAELNIAQISRRGPGCTHLIKSIAEGATPASVAAVAKYTRPLCESIVRSLITGEMAHQMLLTLSSNNPRSNANSLDNTCFELA
jgi:hypothetical protein